MSPLTVDSLPDIHHLIYLRNRLWARRPLGRAAVMIGAGFSLNAESKVAGSRSFPLWREITARMLDELRPLLKSEAREKALDQAASGSGSLTLAREYEATFGRSALDDLIIGLVPDSNYSPGPLHQSLLALPWADVFTTNYDTLLERTAPGEQGRYYDVVVQPSDLPNSTQPRIVKLHGSLPTNKPFIITEEDFRRYPKEFAPFVNTVQQSMMENDFVLLGFSGDDPNFLSWLGWVRDELTTLRPRVYLCGVLDITDAQRLVLRERGVTAIDLGPLFPRDADYPDTRSKRNREALTWLLHSLHNGQALEPPVQWPHFPEPLDIPSSPLSVKPLTALAEAKSEPITHFKRVPSFIPGREAPTYTEEAEKELTRLIGHWQQLHREYPGWLILPHKNRQSLLQRTKNLRWPLVGWLTTLSPTRRLLPLSELVWRLERSVQLMYAKEYELCQQIIQEVPLPTSPLKQEQWATIGFAMLRSLRHSYDHQGFERLLTQLEPLAESQPRYAAWRCWQAAMERLEHLDQPGARHWLQQWPTVNNDPAWDLRRAGLWAEINDLETAERYALAALDTALQQQPRLEIRIDMLSVEEAARTLLRNIRAEQRWQSKDKKQFHSNSPTRAELARHKLYAEYRCDALADIGIAEAELKDTEPILQRAIYESINPYTGFRIRNRTSRGGINLADYQAAFDVLESQEQRGQPFRFANTHYERVAAAAKWLLVIALPRAIGVIMRSGDDKLLQLIDKAAIAGLETAELTPLLEKAVEVGEGFFPPAGSRQRPASHSRHQVEYVTLALRLLGRAAFCLAEPLRSRAVQLALGVWENWPYQLSANDWIKRDHFADFTIGITAVLTREEVLTHFALLIAAGPEPELAEGALESVPKELLPDSRPSGPDIARAVGTCLDWLSSAPESIERRTGLRRLLYLQELGWLTPEEREVFGRKIWSSDKTSNDLPILDEHLATWTVLLIPAPPDTEAPVRLKRQLLSAFKSLFGAADEPSGRRMTIEQLLSDMLNATRPAADKLMTEERLNRDWIDWTREEALEIFELIESFLQARLTKLEAVASAKRGETFDFEDDDYEECRYLGRLVGDIVLPHICPADAAIAERVYACAKQLLKADLPARILLPFLLPLLSHRADLVSFTTTSIRLALTHPSNAGIVQDGAEAFCRWAYGAYRSVLPAPPEGTVYEYLVRIGLPGLPNLLAVVVWATDLLTAAPSIIWPEHASLLGEVLDSLLQETSLPTWRERNLARHVTEQERLFQRPRIRERAARLAGQLAWLNSRQPVPGLENTLRDWEEAAGRDIFPEVRRAWQVGNRNASLEANWHSRVAE